MKKSSCMTVKEMMRRKIAFGQFYTHAMVSKDVHFMTDVLCDNAVTDIMKEMAERGVELDEESVKAEVESLRRTLYWSMHVLSRHDFHPSRVPLNDWTAAFPMMVPFVSEGTESSANLLLYLRPCQFSRHGRKIEIEFND